MPGIRPLFGSDAVLAYLTNKLILEIPDDGTFAPAPHIRASTRHYLSPVALAAGDAAAPMHHAGIAPRHASPDSFPGDPASARRD